ncbi:MAG: ribosome maturation factor RimM [Lewinella sp.]
MDLIEIGWTGKAHGLKGEIKLRIQEFYEEDLLATKSMLIGDPAIPYFLESLRAGGAIIAKFENLDSREQVTLLSNKPVWLLASQVTAVDEGEDLTPWDPIIGFTIKAEGYPDLGPITGIMDMPEHYLAELTHEGKAILVPLHEDLVVALDEEVETMTMVLPEGLLTLG